MIDCELCGQEAVGLVPYVSNNIEIPACRECILEYELSDPSSHEFILDTETDNFCALCGTEQKEHFLNE